MTDQNVPSPPLNMIRLAAVALGAVGVLLLMQALNVLGAAPTGTPITQAAPVTGSTTANVSFTKVSGPCRLASRFSDRFSVVAKDGALTLTQLSNSHVSRGTISPNGEFSTSAEGQGYRGTITGTTGTGQHTYTAQGCNEVYDLAMQLSGPLIATTGGAGAGTVPAGGDGGVNIPLSGLGLVFVIGAIGLFLGAPRLAGGPLIAQQKAEGDCEREKAREAAARQALAAAEERLRNVQELQSNAESTRREAEAKQGAAAAAARGAASYQGADGRTVYTNPQQRGRIESAQGEAAAARSAADAAQGAYDAAGGAGGLQAAGDELYRANREWSDAKASLDACLRIVSLATPAPGPSGGATTGGATAGGTGVGQATGTGTSDGTRTRPRNEPPCPPGKKENETTTEHRFYVHDMGNAQIETEGTRLNTDDRHARGFLDHLGRLDKGFKAGKIARGVTGGEVVGPVLDAIDFPDFTTYFGAVRERLDETMETFLEQMRQQRRQAAYTIRYTTHHFLLTCEKWDECDGEQFVPKSKITLSLVRSAQGSIGPEMLTDEDIRRTWLDNWFRSLRGHNERAESDAAAFRQRCQ